MEPRTILDAIGELPRVELARKMTPLEEMPRLRAAIAESMDADVGSVPQLFIKREDTTGFAFGGNKARHMEFFFGHLLERGIDTLVNINHYDSNNARLVAAACAHTGMKCHLVSFDHVEAPVAGNLLIGHLSGAEIHRVERDAARPLAEELRDAEIAAGRSAVIVSDVPFFEIAGLIGFVETGWELAGQLVDVGLGGSAVHIWGLCGRSIAGIRLYGRNTGQSWTATATAQQTFFPSTYEGIYLDRSARVSELLGLSVSLEPGDISTLAGYTGTYGYTTAGAIEAIHLVAGTEGIILDPNYTGKAMSGLLDQVRRGNVDPGVPVVFIHTGGLPQTFVFAEELVGWRG